MNTSPEFFTALAERLGWALLHSLWQGALAAAVLAVALRVLRGRPAARHAACLLALLALVIAVAMTLAHQPVVSIKASASPNRPVSQATVVSQPPELAVSRSGTLSPRRESEPLRWRGDSVVGKPPFRERIEPLLPWISVVWILGVALLSLRHFVGWRRLCALRRSGVKARPELQRKFARLLEKFGRSAAVRLLESGEAAVPMLAGLLKPAVLLPLRVITGLHEDEVEAILAHELAHLVRRDAWSHLAQVAIETLLFYHPAVWWIGRVARQERENAADDLALAVCADRRVYAGALAHLAEMHLGSQAALAATGGSLLARIRRIVRPAPAESSASGWSLGIPALLTVLAVTAIIHAHADDAKPVDAVAKPNAKELAQKAAADAKQWLADAFQLEDKTKREAAIEKIRAAMTSGNAGDARAGVTAFVGLGPVEFDKASFRPAVRTLLKSEDPATRAAAASAITLTGADPEDIERVLALADDPAPEVRQGLSWIIAQLHKNDLTARAGDAVLKLLAGNERAQLREGLRGIWGAKFSPALEARVVELSQNLEDTNGVAYDAMYFALSTQANKSEASVKRLIELLAHQDTGNVAGRCAWGLQQGVDRAQFALVGDAMVKVIESRSDGYLRNNALRCLRAYGNAAQAPALKAVLAKPGVTGDLRKTLEETLTALEARPVPGAEPLEKIAATPVPAPPATVAKAAEKPEIEVEWKGQWWPATVLKKDGGKTQIHYTGYGAEWVEWVTAERIRPLKTNAAAEQVAETGVVQVENNDSLLWNGEQISLESLREKLKSHVNRKADFAVVVRSSKDVNYQSVVKVLDLCREVKVTKVAFATTATEPDPKVAEQERTAKWVEKNRQAARVRAAEDKQRYTFEQLGEIETLYQVANTKGKRSPEARASLKTLLEKYGEANRTGCATLYLGQASEGAERLEYLTRAVEKFSDCYYFNGCQVGGYGRYVLALTLWEKGEKDKARALFAELKTTYKDATDHRGKPMGEIAEAVEKELAAKE